MKCGYGLRFGAQGDRMILNSWPNDLEFLSTSWPQDHDYSHTDTDTPAGTPYVYRVKAIGSTGLSGPSNFVQVEPVEETGQGSEQPGTNSLATGAPTISGMALVGETLTADTSGIADADGLEDASFSYQWTAGGSDIDGATGSSYTFTSSEQGQTIRVRVSFTDDQGNDETLTSGATAEVTLAALRIESATVDGSAMTLTYNEILDEGVSLPTVAFSVKVNGNNRAVTGVSVSDKTVVLTLASAVQAGEPVSVSYTRPDGPDFIRDTLGNVAVSFTDQAVVNDTDSEGTSQQNAPQNSPATGAPTISGTAQVGETLTADTSGIADEDGLDNVSFGYQWVRNDGSTDTDIQDATGSTYTLTSQDQGKTVKMRVSFTDDAGNEESLTSEATAAVELPPKPTNLTAAVNADGTITLSWDAPDDDSVTGYQILRRRPREGEDTLLVYVADTGATATTYTDANTPSGTLYVYRVKAIYGEVLSKRSNYVNVDP